MNQSSMRMGWQPLAALLLDEPAKPSRRTPEPLRFSASEMAERRLMDVAAKINGAAQAGTTAAAKVGTARLLPVVAPPSPKFKVGDRVRPVYSSALWTDSVLIKVGVGHVGAMCAWYMLDGREEFDQIEDLELIPQSTKPAEPEAIVPEMWKVYLTMTEVGEWFSRWDGAWCPHAFFAKEAAERRGASIRQDRTIIREATQAELEGRS